MKAAFTIATANYLAQAKTIADSFLAHNQDYKFFIFLLDKIQNRFDIAFFNPAVVIEIESLGIEGFSEMKNKYSIFELSNALKPFAAEFLFILKQFDVVLYFDSDLFVYNSFIEIDSLFETNDILLTPHIVIPLPLDNLVPEEKSFLNAGIYNGGFFALRKSNETFKFLRWWKERMISECVINFAAGLFVDQIWLNLVPLFFNKVGIISNIGYNTAYWNLHERSLTLENNEWLINNKVPLVFFHFSGYNLNYPDLVSKYQTRYNFEQRPDIAPLFIIYREDVLRNRYEDYQKHVCVYVLEKQKLEEEQKAILAEKQRLENKITIKRIFKAIQRRL